jgi:Zn-dependent peptidase ImmA (M78 family)
MSNTQRQRKILGWHTDTNGVPVLSADDIEQIADDFLERFDSKCLESPKPVNFGKVIALLREKYNVSFVFNKSLGKDKNGNRYAGYYEVNTRSIYIDVSLAFKRKQWAFVLAHEIGHFILRSNNFLILISLSTIN